MTVTADLLYEEDFYAWTQQQAELLGRLPAISNELDMSTLPRRSRIWDAIPRGTVALPAHHKTFVQARIFGAYGTRRSLARRNRRVAAPAGADFDAQHPREARFAGRLSDDAAARAQARARCARVFEPISGRVPLRTR